jgi:hypothetical protein
MSRARYSIGGVVAAAVMTMAGVGVGVVGVVATGTAAGCTDSGAAEHRLVAPEPAPTAVTRPAAPQPPCRNAPDPHLLVVDRVVAPGQPLRVLVVSEAPLGDAVLLDESGRTPTRIGTPESGPPYARIYRARAPESAGRPAYRLTRPDGRVLACVQGRVAPQTPTDRAEPARAHAPASGIWRTTRRWSDTWERVFSAWIAHLFRPLPDQPVAWWPLHQVLRDPVRNLLHNRLGLHEDDAEGAARVVAVADCGDTPYQLRAYFAWKLGLPFRFRRCTRGTGLHGPLCPVDRDNRNPKFDHIAHPVRRFNAFIRRGLAWAVHSGTTRTLPEDEGSDFYPIALNRHSIRPGTIFVDVGGHVLVVSRWDEDGLYAIDGHPDFSVTRRRFEPEYFRYFLGTRTGGFKAFRPLRDREGRLTPVPNEELQRFFSLEQYEFRSRRAFYRAMDRLLSANQTG